MFVQTLKFLVKVYKRVKYKFYYGDWNAGKYKSVA